MTTRTATGPAAYRTDPDGTPKTGQGRPTAGARRVPDVSRLACPQAPAPPVTRGPYTHHIEPHHVGRGVYVWACCYCRKTWIELDAEVRS